MSEERRGTAIKKDEQYACTRQHITLDESALLGGINGTCVGR
jgi:hypothetical protein